MISISFIIPTFNRVDTIDHAVLSAIKCGKDYDCDFEIIIVDDASNDSTFESINYTFKSLITKKKIKIIKNPLNLGVVASREIAIKNSSKNWLTFLDSDNVLIPENFKKCLNVIINNKSISIFFFRTQDLETKNLIGGIQDKESLLSFKSLLNHGTPGECIIVTRRQNLIINLFENELRGFEILGYLKLLKIKKQALISPIIILNYNQKNSYSRLSDKANIRQRSKLLLKGYFILLKKYYKYMNLKMLFRTSLAIVYYFIKSTFKF